MTIFLRGVFVNLQIGKEIKAEKTHHRFKLNHNLVPFQKQMETLAKQELPP